MESLRKYLLNNRVSKRQSFINDFFKSMDKDFSRLIDYDEFKQGIVGLGVNLSENDLRDLFNEFDVKKDGKIDYVEFVQGLKPNLSPLRKKVVDAAFRKLDINKDGVLSVDDFKHIYLEQAKNHPNCLQGKWTVEQALRSFLNAFDSPDDPDGIVTLEEFRNYYSIISATIPDDTYFVFLIQSCFGI